MLLRIIPVDGYNFSLFSIKHCLVFHWMNIHYFIYPFSCWRAFGSFPLFCCTNNVELLCLLAHMAKSFPRAVILNVLSMDLLGSTLSFSRGLQGRNYFHNDTEMLSAFFTALIFALMGKTNDGSNHCSFSMNQSNGANSASSHFLLHHHALNKTKNA